MFCSNCGSKIEEGEKFCSSCGHKVKEKTSIKKKKEEKNSLSINKLIDYLNKVKTLEIRKYALDNCLINSEKELENLPYTKIKPQKFDFDYSAKDIVKTGIITFLVSALFISPFIVYILFRDIIENTEGYENIEAIILIFIVYIASVILITTLNTIRKAHKLRKTKHQQEIEKKEDLEKVKKQNAKVDEKITDITIKKEDTEYELKETEKLLTKLYNLNYIHKKYHNNFVAVISFLDYLETGRCDSLEGYTGAYNIFENEIRQNTIIAKLDDILVSLEQIKQNQYAIYCAIQTGNELTSRMMKSNKKISQNAEIIAENSEIITYLGLIKE